VQDKTPGQSCESQTSGCTTVFTCCGVCVSIQCRAALEQPWGQRSLYLLPLWLRASLERWDSQVQSFSLLTWAKSFKWELSHFRSILHNWAVCRGVPQLELVHAQGCYNGSRRILAVQADHEVGQLRCSFCTSAFWYFQTNARDFNLFF